MLKSNSQVACRLLKQSDDFIFFEKSTAVHSVALNDSEENSVANWLSAIDSKCVGVGSDLECGVAHRLDFGTSGVMVAARSQQSWEWLRKQFAEKKVEKIYVCLVQNPVQTGFYEAFAGKHPKSAKRVLIKSAEAKLTQVQKNKLTRIQTEVITCESCSLGYRLRLRILTGYRHQIRAHLAFLGAPIVGDVIYRGVPADRLMLHAEYLGVAGCDGNWYECASATPF